MLMLLLRKGRGVVVVVELGLAQVAQRSVFDSFTTESNVTGQGPLNLATSSTNNF